jgi:hypothetical protein
MKMQGQRTTRVFLDETHVFLDGDEAQLAFEDVVEMEHQPGDPEYTAWVAAGKPKLDKK